MIWKSCHDMTVVARIDAQRIGIAMPGGRVSIYISCNALFALSTKKTHTHTNLRCVMRCTHVDDDSGWDNQHFSQLMKSSQAPFSHSRAYFKFFRLDMCRCQCVWVNYVLHACCVTKEKRKLQMANKILSFRMIKNKWATHLTEFVHTCSFVHFNAAFWFFLPHFFLCVITSLHFIQ